MENIFSGIDNIEQMHSVPKKLGILGGSFNPVHLGHTYIANFVKEEFSLNRVLMLPLGNPPHKNIENFADAEHRYAMLELAIKNYPGLFASRMEMLRPGKTYTVDTLNRLSALENAKLYYIIGSDTLFELPEWKNLDEVFKLCEFICVVRQGENISLICDTINTYFDKLNVLINLSKAVVPGISSTDIRKRLANGVKSLDGLVCADVIEYLYKNKVYL